MGGEKMKNFSHKGTTYELDEQGCLIVPESWDKNFAEGIARDCEIPVLSAEHWDVINYVRDAYGKTGVCPTIFATCKAIGLRPEEMKKLFPTGYHRGVCLVAGIHYRVSHMPYASHIRESIVDQQALAKDKIYCTDVRGFLIDPETWDENYAIHRAMDMKIPPGKLTDDHWRIIHYLREMYHHENRIPNIYETCENCSLDLDALEALFPDGYHRGAIKIAGLRFAK
jgi:tRNA 2-thiouridine synthesizing protein E